MSNESAARTAKNRISDGDGVVRIEGVRISPLRRAWDRVPSSMRRPVVAVMRNETFRSRFLARIGVRDEKAFLTLSNGGPAAIDFALDRLDQKRISGHYYEFGLYRGYTFWHAQRAADRRGFTDMRFYGFDSFEGLPEVQGPDRKAAIFVPGDYRCTRENVENMLEQRGFDFSRAALVEGYFDASLTDEVRDEHSMGTAALVMVDCDLYQSTVPVLAFTSQFLQDGTIVLFDDWYCFGEDSNRGEPRAFREFLAAHPEWSAEPIVTFGAYGRGFEMRRAGIGQ